MQISNLGSAAPTAPAPAKSAPRESGFDAVYEADSHQHRTSDRSASQQPSDNAAAKSEDVRRERGQPAGAESDEATEADQANKLDVTDAPQPEVAIENRDGPTPRDVAEAAAIPAPVGDAPELEDVDPANIPIPATAEADSRRPAPTAVVAGPDARVPASSGRGAPEGETNARAVSAAPATPSSDGDATHRAENIARPVPTAPASDVAVRAQTASAQAASAVVASSAPTPPPSEELVVRRGRAAVPDDGVEARVDTTRNTAAKAPKPLAIAEPAMKPQGETSKPEVVDSGVTEAGPVEGNSKSESAARVEATVRHEAPRPVMQQVAEAARALRDGPVELTLKPEELGKVRMTMTAGADGTMTMSLQAERPETLDLMRRHIADLARDLQAMGFENLSFSFGQDRASPERQQDLPEAEKDRDSVVAAIPLANHGFADRPRAVTTGGLDLRI